MRIIFVFEVIWTRVLFRWIGDAAAFALFSMETRDCHEMKHVLFCGAMAC